MEDHLKEVYQKAAHFCAYQERTHDEVRQKLDKLFVLPEDSEQIIAKLIEDNFLNEERFAKSFAGGKFRMKRWGRKKILQELKRRKISEYNIRTAMKEIPQDAYSSTFRAVAAKKLEEIQKKESNKLMQKKKLASFLLQKGYEPDLVWNTLEEFFRNQ